MILGTLLSFDWSVFFVNYFFVNCEYFVNLNHLKLRKKLKKCVKNLWVHIDKILIFQDEVNHLKKMARGIQLIYTLRNRIPTFLMKTVLNAFVISHLQYSLL